MRPIDADALMKTLGITDMDCGKCKWGDHGYCTRGSSFTDACTAIEDAPSVEERKTGMWLDKEVIDDRKDAKIQQWQQARCSCCNKWHTTPYMYYFTNYDFCPNCGADMRGEQNE